ncbi:DUF1905 domain-containing protein [Rasiella rasia]|uniref:DUF1905 domain-containing protein n=1 Tax=Rasiella rasia TaxID=2744027 RepID=A0A6G6GHS0_9FLAO|nr:DUF1905 domain-containing protein [Rasiella rasia]QIE58050.1 DUF1905 domain-containing protein [Rasiella rasia]
MYEFSAKVWQHTTPGGWYFVTLPQDMSKEIKLYFGKQEEGWGRMKVTALIDNYKWSSAIWFDSKSETYVLPVKAEVRKKFNIDANSEINIKLWV